MTRPRRAARPSRRTIALIGLWTVTVSLYSVFVPVHAALYGTPPALAFLLGAAVCGALPLSLSRPRTAIALFCAAIFVVPLVTDAALASTAPWPWSVPSTLALVGITGLVTSVHGARWGALPLGVGLAASLTAAVLRPDIIDIPGVGATATADLIVTASVGVVTLLLALLIASRLRIGAELTREREHSALEESRRALVEERTRIARELHDVIAHSMSVIQVQASTARYRLPSIDAAAAAEFDDIAATARTSLSEMRRMLGVLRTEDQAVELAPQNGIDDIPALVDTIRRAGVDVGLSLVGMDAAASAPTAVQIATYRIVQESLSNAVRHASGNAVTVELQANATALRLRVRNSAPAEAQDRGTGHGLRGMRERAEVLGGSLSAGPAPDGAWLVEAALPLAGGRDDPPSPASAPPKENP
ncbi:sensor histidine kinase [Microbacterium sp. NPDC090225]|uniref:sensor histidine kinase n=1 Tax=Microbacterium sp. NPDC090225 TaxID=3364207 RepID=UPI00382AFCBB